MAVLNKKRCPVCDAELKKEIICCYQNDTIIVECDDCGKYAMSKEFYEDHVEQASKTNNREKMVVFLKKHKADQLHPFFSEAPIQVANGFKNYPYQVCILSTKLDK